MGTRKRMQTRHSISLSLIAHNNRSSRSWTAAGRGAIPPNLWYRHGEAMRAAAQSATQITYAVIRLLAPPSLMATCQPVGTPPSENGVGRLHCSTTVAIFTSRMS